MFLKHVQVIHYVYKKYPYFLKSKKLNQGVKHICKKWTDDINCKSYEKNDVLGYYKNLPKYLFIHHGKKMHSYDQRI